MSNVARAVVEFDESVLAPWRPPLRAAVPVWRAPLRAVPDPAPGRPSVPSPVAVRTVGGRPARRPVQLPPAWEQAPGASRPTARSLGRQAGRHWGDAFPPVDRGVPALRLTRRARRLGVVLGLAVGVALGSWVGSAVTADGGQLRLAGESSVVVRQGDSLWSIAAAVAGEEDVRVVVDEIRDLNGLADASLVPGQVLVLP